MIQKDGKTYCDPIEAKTLLSNWIQEDAQLLRDDLHVIKSKHAIEYV